MSGKFKLVHHSGFDIVLLVSVSLFGLLLYQKFNSSLLQHFGEDYRQASVSSFCSWLESLHGVSKSTN